MTTTWLARVQLLNPARRGVATGTLVRRLGWLVLAALALLPLLRAAYPPLYDYYHWVFQGDVVQDLLTGSPDVAAIERAYTLNWAPIPNLGAPIGIALAAYWFTPLVAGRVFLAVCVFLFAAGFAVLSRAIQGRPTAAEYLGFLWAYGYFMYKGYDSFLLALSLCFFILAYLHRATAGATLPVSGRGLVLLAGLSLVVYLAHLLAWAILAVVLVTYATYLWRRGRSAAARGLVISQAPVGLLLAWYVLASGGQSAVSYYNALSDKLLSLTEPLLLALRTDPLPPVVPILWVNVAGYALLLVVLALNITLPRRLAVPPLAVAALLVGGLGVVLPISSLGEAIRPDERFILPAGLFLLLVLPWRPLALARAIPAVLLVLAIVGFHLVEYQEASTQLATIRSMLGAAIPDNTPTASLTIFRDEVNGGCTAQPGPTIGTATLKWFGLMHLFRGDNVSANVMTTSLVQLQPDGAGPADLAVTVLSPAEARDATRLLAQVAPYAAISVFGCPADVTATTAALAPRYHLVQSEGIAAVLLGGAAP